MKSLFAAAALSFATLAACQTSHTYADEHPLASSGTVVFTMNVGDVKVLPNPRPDRVRIEIRTNRAVDQETMAGWIQRFEVAAGRATIEVRIPNHNLTNDSSTDVTLYVPPQSDLKADLEVGDLTIRGIDGNKDVHTGVGDLRIAIANPSDYGHVETHTRIGDVSDFLNHSSDDSGFLGKTEDFTLSGRFHLKATTGVGDVHISADGKS